ncbi:MAG: HlyD family secretion protein [Candidatus Eremiobacteraeota bacterium]|nr:HlyD family secretion protein [Candidatus Eremiobacteraeota bacterium]
METTTPKPTASELVTPQGQPVAEEHSGPPKWARTAGIVVGAIVLVFVLIWGARAIAYATTHQTTDDAQIDADQVELTSKIVERVDKILADTNQQVSRGQLLIQLDDRDERARVLQAKANRDAVLAQARAAQANVALTRDTQAAQDIQNAGAVAQAQAAVAGASANAQSSEGQISVAQAGVSAAAAQVQAAKDAIPGVYQNMLRAKADLRRTQSLVSTGDVAAAQLDAARASYEAARSAYTQAQAGVATAQANLAQARERLNSQRYATSGTQSQIGQQAATVTTAQGKLAESSSPNRVAAQQAQADAAAAQVETAQAQLKTAQDQLSYTQIRSPIDGYVGAKNVAIGATVQPGQSLMTIVPSQNIYVTANFKETQLGKMRVGQQTDIGVDACKGIALTGHVVAISPASQNKFSLVPAQNATGNFVKVTQRVPVRIAFDRPDPSCPLRPGMSVEASVKVK